VIIFLSKEFQLAPFIGIVSAQKVGADITIGLTPKLYFNTNRLAPFADLKIGQIINRPSKDNLSVTNNGIKNTTDILVGIGVGGEYFLSRNFSFSVEGQWNLTKSDINSNRFGNPGGINMNLATAVSASVYF